VEYTLDVSDTPAEIRVALHAQFARIGRAVASSKRIELLELLCQGERTVDALARATGMRLTNASQHLQVLKAAHLVEVRREGTRVHYRAAGDGVCQFTSELAELARSQLAEVERIAREYLDTPDPLQPLTRAELRRRLVRGKVTLIDVRPLEEYRAGHIPGALSLPLAELRRRLRELPKQSLIVAYCRGPYCVLAPKAVQILNARGFQARRLEDGLPEWRAAGLPVEIAA